MYQQQHLQQHTPITHKRILGRCCPTPYTATKQERPFASQHLPGLSVNSASALQQRRGCPLICTDSVGQFMCVVQLYVCTFIYTSKYINTYKQLSYACPKSKNVFARATCYTYLRHIYMYTVHVVHAPSKCLDIDKHILTHAFVSTHVVNMLTGVYTYTHTYIHTYIFICTHCGCTCVRMAVSMDCLHACMCV